MSEFDRDLALHEIGHALAEAAEGCAVSIIRKDGDDGAMCLGFTFERSGPEQMDSTVSILVAASAFTVALDSRLADLSFADKLKAGAAITVLTAQLGVAEEDFEALKGLGALWETETGHGATHELHMQARRWTMIAMAQAPAWRALAEHVAAQIDRDGFCPMAGAKLRGMLEGTQIFENMASIPGMFVTDESLAQIARDVPEMCSAIAPGDAVEMLTAQAGAETPAAGARPLILSRDAADRLAVELRNP